MDVFFLLAVPVLHGRTAIQVYYEFMLEFRSEFILYIDDPNPVLVECQIGRSLQVERSVLAVFSILLLLIRSGPEWSLETRPEGFYDLAGLKIKPAYFKDRRK